MADPEHPGSGLVETIRRTVEASPVFEESGVQEQLLDGLTEAQDELSRIKAENRQALRDATRQVRIGAAATAPNLVLISADRLGYGDLGCYGQTPYNTPNLNRLGSGGIRFTQFYAGSANARAARWCLLTGLNTGRAPAAPQGQDGYTLSGERDTLAEALWRAGYATGFVGLWGQEGLPTHHGFDEWTGFRTREQAVPFPEFINVDTGRARIVANADGELRVAAGEFLADEALAFIARQASAGRPFFLHLALPAEIAASSGSGSPADYITELDALVGRLTGWLEDSRLSSRTCVVFLSETAPEASSTAGSDRSSRTGALRITSDGLGEGNLRVPLIVTWPGHIPAGVTSPHLCGVWDLLPTLAELAHAQRRPPRMDGLSFVPTLLGGTQREHAIMYWETRGSGFGQAVRKGQWKGVRHAGQSALALYDLVADPQESTDLSRLRPEVVEQLVVRKR
jgi:arylsulfatase A-like enzyme